MGNKKPIASISLDLDNQWSYMKIHGDAGWEKFPSYLNIFIPHVLDVLDSLDLKVTFFIVGKDATIEENKRYIKMITARGHEVGNHSFNHESWLQSYSFGQIEEEIQLAEEAIFETTGQRPIGFRGPGFSWSRDLLKVLKKRGYLFDASTLPTYIGPLARLYYFWTSNLSKEEKKERKELFGSFKEGFRPLKPYFWKLNDSDKIFEIPVTTIPLFKIPFHLSYLLFLSGFSMFIMKAYLHFALIMCKITGVRPNYLLHPLDVIGGDQIPQLSFFPGMNIPSDKKVRIFSTAIGILKKYYDLQPMSTYASTLNHPKLKSCDK